MKDLSALRQAPLDIDAGAGLTYTVPPPTAETGRLLGRLISLGMTAAQAGADRDALDKAMNDQLTDEERAILERPAALERLALTDAVVDRMEADGLPAADITVFGRYAAYYWIFGEATADKIMLAAPDPEAGATFPKPSKNGRSTASANPKPTARTSATGRSRGISASSSTRGSTRKRK